MKKEIDYLKELNKTALKKRHMFEIEQNTWKIFEPTRFIFSYFVFNSFYSIDWVNSFKYNKISYYDDIEDDSLSKEIVANIINEISNESLLILSEYFNVDFKRFKKNHTSENKKIKNVGSFIFEFLFINDIEFNDFHKTCFKDYLILDNSYIAGKGIEALIIDLDDINEDSRIKNNMITNFKKSIIKLYNREKIESNDFNKILNFISMIRNNIFHGSKTILDMQDKNQIKRIKLYTNFLNAFNSILLKKIDSLFIY